MPMKITKISSDELELQEGRAQGLTIGIILIVAAAPAGIYLPNPFALWIAGGLAVVGVAAILLSSSITVSASKTSGLIRFEKKRLIGARDSTFAISDVFRIETRKEWQMNHAPTGDPNQQVQQPVLVAQSVVVFKDGRELALDHQKTSSTISAGSAVLMSGQGAETAMAAQVAKFLEVPFAEIAPPNMGTGINIIGN
jgi:hypothetical protein